MWRERQGFCEANAVRFEEALAEERGYTAGRSPSRLASNPLTTRTFPLLVFTVQLRPKISSGLTPSAFKFLVTKNFEAIESGEKLGLGRKRSFDIRMTNTKLGAQLFDSSSIRI